MNTLLLVSMLCAAPDKELQVLFIGNSLTENNELPWMVLQMARADGIPMRYEQVTGGGMQLEHHWGSGKGDAVQKIARGKWDIVVLQEHSERPLTEPAKFLQYAKAFHGKIKAAGAKTFLYVTWPKKGTPEKQAEVDKAYASVAKELGATLVPVGPAFTRLSKDRPDLELYDEDGVHPTPIGTYLNALVFHRALHGAPPKTPPKRIALLGNVIVDLDEADAGPELLPVLLKAAAP